MIRTATADERIVVLLRHTATRRSPTGHIRPRTRRLRRRELDGYDLDYVTINDAHVDGTVFTISETELAAADEYEVDTYQRISVPLRSGPHAWVYVFAG
jgi:gamma-glutamylcyclotransferase (GGCT)/AIG2-like uncharacterized protein YtfP